MESIKVTQVPAVLVRLGSRMAGTLHLTRHHMIFRGDKREIWISYPVIAEVVRRPAGGGDKAIIRLVGKDFMFLQIEFENDQDAKAVYDTLVTLCHPEDLENLYAFTYQPAPAERQFDGWSLYDPIKEYERMGIDFGSGDSGASSWRVSRANASYSLCPTYPKVLVVPASINDIVLAHAAKYRSKGRLPVLSYFHRFNKCTISRCAQPLVGLKQHRNPQDEKLIMAIYDTTQLPEGVKGAQVDNVIIDLRPATNALAQTALGGGTENMDRYRPARKQYVGIDNLHVMRDCMNKVVDALRHGDVSSSPPSAVALEKSQWLRHLQIILDAVRQVVAQVHFKCSHVVLHCSDGWDRTPQISSLSMLLLDKYYRTLEGFAVLVEKEWLSFGHQFETRGNNLGKKAFSVISEDGAGSMFSNVTNFISESTRGRHTGPIFQQFLDCVYQMVSAMPDHFEFNERFLRRLLYHSYACQYGTFLLDSERERVDADVRENTRSVWDYFMARKSQFVNPTYIETDEVLLPPDKVHWWSGAFGRADSDMNDPDAWRRDPLRDSATPGKASPNLTASVVGESVGTIDSDLDTKLSSQMQGLGVNDVREAIRDGIQESVAS